MDFRDAMRLHANKSPANDISTSLQLPKGYKDSVVHQHAKRYATSGGQSRRT